MSLVEKIDGVADAVGFDANGVGASGILNADVMLQYGNEWTSFLAYTAGSFILYFALGNFLRAYSSYRRAK